MAKQKSTPKPPAASPPAAPAAADPNLVIQILEKQRNDVTNALNHTGLMLALEQIKTAGLEKKCAELQQKLADLEKLTSSAK